MVYALLLVLTACSGKEEDDTAGGGGNGGNNGGDNGGETGDTAPPPWEPTAGTYNLTSGETLKDTCNLPDEGGGDTGLTSASQVDIQVAADKASITMTIPDSNGGDPLVVTCPRTEYSFHCDLADVEDSETAGQYGLNATILLSIDQDGTWANETHIDGMYTYTTDCRGPDCGTVADVIGYQTGKDFSFPCGGKVAFTADHA